MKGEEKQYIVKSIKKEFCALKLYFKRREK